MSSHAARVNEKLLAKRKIFEDQNKTKLCWINIIATVVTVFLVVGTLHVLNAEEASCKGTYLRLTLWLMLIMHATNILESVCQLTGLNKIFCGCFCTLAFFLYELGVLTYMQSIFYSSPECRAETPKQYWWLLVNIIVYFGFFLTTIYISVKSWIAQPSAKEAEEEVTSEETNTSGKTNTLH